MNYIETETNLLVLWHIQKSIFIGKVMIQVTTKNIEETLCINTDNEVPSGATQE